MMCTAITYTSKDHYFGRNLDLEFSYQETVTITPRQYPFSFRNAGLVNCHFAMIGMAYVSENYPLYYEATNEKGLSMAGLNFPGNAFYLPQAKEGHTGIAPFEFIPWILSQCVDLSQAREKLNRMDLIQVSFSSQLPASPLHWMIADHTGALVVETMQDGLKIYDNPVGVLTNNPPFDQQLFYLNNYRSLSREPVDNNFGTALDQYSRGMGTMGLPGGLDSMSRFVKAAFTRVNSISGDSESESVSQFYHILDSVAQQRGLVHLGENQYELTIYSSCCNTDRGIYYYKTYENSRITAVDMHREDLDCVELVSYPLQKEQDILLQNR